MDAVESVLKLSTTTISSAHVRLSRHRRMPFSSFPAVTQALIFSLIALGDVLLKVKGGTLHGELSAGKCKRGEEGLVGGVSRDRAGLP